MKRLHLLLYAAVALSSITFAAVQPEAAADLSSHGVLLDVLADAGIDRDRSQPSDDR